MSNWKGYGFLLPDPEIWYGSCYSGTCLSDHLTKIPIGSSVSQIAISETSRKRPPPLSDHLSLTSRVVAYGGSSVFSL